MNRREFLTQVACAMAVAKQPCNIFVETKGTVLIPMSLIVNDKQVCWFVQSSPPGLIYWSANQDACSWSVDPDAREWLV